MLQTDTNPLVHFHIILVWTTKIQYLFPSILLKTYRYEQGNVFLWTTKFQSGQVNPKFYLPTLATKVCGSVYSTVSKLFKSLLVWVHLAYKLSYQDGCHSNKNQPFTTII